MFPFNPGSILNRFYCSNYNTELADTECSPQLKLVLRNGLGGLRLQLMFK